MKWYEGEGWVEQMLNTEDNEEERMPVERYVSKVLSATLKSFFFFRFRTLQVKRDTQAFPHFTVGALQQPFWLMTSHKADLFAR